MFLSAKCNMCHAVSSVGIEAKVKSEKMKGPDLVGVKAESDWLAQYLRKKADKDGKPHKNEFKGTDEELALLIGWVKEQQATE